MGSNYVFHVCRFERFAASEDPGSVLQEIARRCNEFQVRSIAADGGGNGNVLNRLLLERLGRRQGFWAILYSAAGQDPRQEGVLMKWTVNRSATIGALFSRVKKRQIVFPKVEDSGSFLDEFACEFAEYDDIARTVRYLHPENQPDDAMHAANYALLLAVRAFPGNRQTVYY